VKKLIIVHGMKRSGNHAIINWLKAHDRFVFFNNIIPIASILRGVKTIPPPVDFTLWLRRELLPRGLQWAFFLKRFALRTRRVIVSLEDHDLQIRPFLNVPCEVTNILILRDPHNLFASRIRKASLVDNPAYPGRAGPAMERVVQVWKGHAREYLGLTDYLDNRLCIYFNSWVSSQDYRRHVSRGLSLEFTDDGFSRVSQIGGGSSFGGTRFADDSLRVDVRNRSSYLTDAERQLHKDVLEDEELRELAHRIAVRNQRYQVMAGEEDA
jgi:hypothetical protein